MWISKREKEIIEIILQANSYITIQEIADRLHVSQRTIYRNISEVEKIMKEYNVELTSTSKKGLQIIGDPKELKEKLEIHVDNQIIDPDERVDSIFMYLLHEQDYVKAEVIGLDNDTSTTTVRHDLEKIKKQLIDTDLTLISKMGAGYLIEGTDIEKNHVLISLVLKHAKENVIYHWIDTHKNDGNLFLNRLDTYGYYDIIKQCHQAFCKIYTRSQYFGDNEYLRWLFLCAFLIYAHKEYRPYQAKIEAKETNEDKKIYKALEKIFSIHLNDEERNYISWALQTNIRQKETEAYALRNYSLNTKIHLFINYVEEHMGIHLKEGSDMVTSLYVHMDKAIHRVRSGISVSNPLVNQTKAQYKELFQVLEDGLAEIFPDIYFPEDEVAYILFYFAAALDQAVKRAFRILVVCSGGMGSSRILASRVEQEIPEIRVAKVTSLLGLTQENLDDYDLILSTIPLYLDKDKYLRVSPLLTQKELRLVQDAIRNHRYAKLRRIDQRETKHRLSQRINSIEKLTQINRLSTVGLNIIVSFYSILIQNMICTRIC